MQHPSTWTAAGAYLAAALSVAAIGCGDPHGPDVRIGNVPAEDAPAALPMGEMPGSWAVQEPLAAKDPAGSAGSGADGAEPPTHSPVPPAGEHMEHQAQEEVRFIAVGDTGTGDEHQAQVARAMADKCASDGCDFVIMLGDNIYDAGPISVDDPRWQTHFEQPYADLDIPFYAVVGNHDVAVDPLFGLGYNPNATLAEVQYSEVSERWKMPAAHYTVSAGPVGLLMLDTTALYNHSIQHGDQHAWVGPARDMLLSKHRWVFAAGHHTYVSNGEHGNAGSYGYFEGDPGHEIKAFIDNHVCGRLDMFLSGHDHSRQWLDESLCAGTDVVVSGAGAKTRGLPGANPIHFQSNALGFFYVHASGDTLTGQFVDEHGQVDFERVIHD